MASRRMIDPAFWQSETMAELTCRQRLLFIGLFSNADDQGRLTAHTGLVRSKIFPLDDISLEDIVEDMQAIAESESILVYETNGRGFIQIINWWDYQSPQWAYPSKIPPPNGWEDRLRYRKNNQEHRQNWGGVGGFNGDDAPPEPLPETEPEIEPCIEGESLGSPLPEALPKDSGRSIVKNSIVKNSIDNAADARPPPASLVKKKTEYSIGQKEFLTLFGAKRFKLSVQAETVLMLEQEYGTMKLTELATWAAKNGMSVGKAVVAVESALKKQKGQIRNGQKVWDASR